MDFIEPILSTAMKIYELVEKLKANKNRCRYVSDRVKALESLVRSITKRKAEKSEDVETTLKELSCTLNSAHTLIEKYTSAKLLKRMLKSGSFEDDFDSVNKRLSDAYQVLSLSLQVEQGNVLDKVFELSSKQWEKDQKEDEDELKKMLLEYMKDQEEKLDSLKNNMEKLVQMLNKPSMTKEGIRLIKQSELKYSGSKKPFMKTPTSEVYKGEYRGFTVAIKRYTDLEKTSSSYVKSIFEKEIETMKRFESPNILRMFGICVRDEDGPNPQFLVIMEYCEKGSLRQVLDSDCTLSWITKARMCLDAAQGLYCLHQSAEKSKVHGSINSSKFMVAEGYRVKLGGFELSKTDTSLRQLSKRKENETMALCYYSPQILGDINHGYSKECEMYSFGILMWEILTRQQPFKDCSDKEIYQKVCIDKFREPLPDDCPDSLAELVDDCRAYESFQRPSAGELMDKLRSVVVKLEDQ